MLKTFKSENARARAPTPAAERSGAGGNRLETEFVLLKCGSRNNRSLTMRYPIYLLLLCLCVGCATQRPIISNEADPAVTNSFSFRRAYSISPARARWFVDHVDDGGHPIIYVGFDEGDHYTRWATLRIREHGAVEREEMREDGELIWVEDK